MQYDLGVVKKTNTNKNFAIQTFVVDTFCIGNAQHETSRSNGDHLRF